MKLNSLRVCQEVSKDLSFLKGRTGLTPNILCRIGFTMSLNDPSIPNPTDYPPDSDRIIDRPLGQAVCDPAQRALPTGWPAVN